VEHCISIRSERWTRIMAMGWNYTLEKNDADDKDTKIEKFLLMYR
jgi:hypothetical protein